METRLKKLYNDAVMMMIEANHAQTTLTDYIKDRVKEKLEEVNATVNVQMFHENYIAITVSFDASQHTPIEATKYILREIGTVLECSMEVANKLTYDEHDKKYRISVNIKLP